MTGDRDLFEAIAPPTRIGRRVFLSGAARAKAERMRREGASGAAIAAELRISEASVWKWLAAELERGLPGGRRPGRPRWAPGEDERAEVERLAARGVTVERIADALGVSSPTLRLHCATELARGRARLADNGAR